MGGSLLSPVENAVRSKSAGRERNVRVEAVNEDPNPEKLAGRLPYPTSGILSACENGVWGARRA